MPALLSLPYGALYSHLVERLQVLSWVGTALVIMRWAHAPIFAMDWIAVLQSSLAQHLRLSATALALS